MPTTLLNESWNVGAAWNSGTANYTFRLEVILTSQDVQNNKSYITVNKYVKGNSGNSWYGTACTDTFTGDITDSFIYNPATAEMRNTEVKYHYGDFEVTHGSDGSKLLSITTKFTRGSNTYAPNTNEKSFTVTLPTIPRASDIILSSSALTISAASGTFGWSVTSKADFYHTLKWQIGSGTEHTVSGLNRVNNTTQSGTINITSILDDMPSSATGTLTFTLLTYNSSSKTSASLIGTKTASCSITITIKPTTALGTTSVVAVSPNTISNYYIAGRSKVSQAITATKPRGAASVSTYISYGVYASSLPIVTVSGVSGTGVSDVLPPKSGTGTNTVTIYAYSRDSRGINGDTVQKTITVYSYTLPVANLTAHRVASSGSRNIDGSGGYLYVKATGTVKSTINNQNSIQSVVAKVNGTQITLNSSGEYWQALATTASASVTLTVSDKVATVDASPVQISVAAYAIHMYDDGRGKVGVGLGGIAIPDYITPYFPITDVEQCFTVSTTGTDLNDYKTTGIYYFSSSYTPTNIPIGVNGWLMVMKGPGAAAVKQLWFRQGTANSNDFNTYVRTYTASTWSNWVRLMYAGETVSKATNATYAQAVNQWETTATARYPVFVNDNNSDAGNYEELHTSGSLMFKQSTNWASINIGTQAYRRGYLSLFDSNSNYYADFTITQGLTANRTVYIPNSNGTILVNDSSNYVQLYSGTLSSGSTTFTGSSYSAYLIVGAEARGYRSSITVPRSLITTTEEQWMVTFYGASSIENVRFGLKASAATGGTITLTWKSGKTIRQIFGIR